MKINTYLNFDGNCEEAFSFYQSVFGGNFVDNKILRFGDIPDMQIADEHKNKVMHIALPIGESVLLGSDIMPDFGHKLTIGNNTYITLYPNSRTEADEIFTKLSADGKIEMEMSEQFFGYFGSFTDKFGVQWMIMVHNS